MKQSAIRLHRFALDGSFKRRRAALGFLVLLISCSGSRNVKKSYSNTFSCILQPSHDTVKIDGLLSVSKLFVADSCLVVLSKQEPFFTVYNMENSRLASRFGQMGRADGEYLSEPKGVNIVKNTLQYYDHESKSLCLISPVDGSVQKISVPYESDFRPINAALINDRLITSGCFSLGYIGYVNDDGSFHRIEDDYPFDTGEISGIQRGVYFQSEIVAAPTGNRFALRLYVSDCFEIYETDSQSVERVFRNEFSSAPVVEGTRINLRKSRAGYIRSYADDEYIYLMKSSESYLDVSSRGLVSNLIDIYNWEGGFVGSLELDSEVGAFCVKGPYMYAVKEDENGSSIIRIDISRVVPAAA